MASVRNPIIKGLKQGTGITTILAEQSDKQPPYPFIGIKFTTPFIVIGQAASYTDERNEVIEQDGEMVISITSYDKTIDGSFNNAFKALEWFKTSGKLELQDAGIVVVKTENMTNRDTFITIDYERRNGFDVRLRIRAKSSKSIETLENMNL